MVIILDKHVVWSYNFIAGYIHVFIVVWNLIWSLNLWSQHKNIFHTSEFSVQSGSKLVNFGLMLNCFGPVRSGENIIGSVRGRGHKVYYFSVRSGSGKKITGQYGFGVPKTLPRRTLHYVLVRDSFHQNYICCNEPEWNVKICCSFVSICFILRVIYVIWMLLKRFENLARRKPNDNVK